MNFDLLLAIFWKYIHYCFVDKLFWAKCIPDILYHNRLGTMKNGGSLISDYIIRSSSWSIKFLQVACWASNKFPWLLYIALNMSFHLASISCKMLKSKEEHTLHVIRFLLITVFASSVQKVNSVRVIIF